LLEGSFARLRDRTAAAAGQPRYVGANAYIPTHHASDATTSGESHSFEMLKPLMRVLVAEEPKPFAPEPRIEPVSPSRVAPQLTAAQEIAPTRVAQSAPSQPPQKDATRPGSREVEDLVVALIAYYEAGDAERLVGLVDGGFWRNAQARNAYSEFFRSTKSRRLRVERLAWNASDGTLKARGEATVEAEYFDRTAPLERRTDLEMDIVLREGKARLTRLSLFPDTR
jgi:hypothetical protein